MDIASARSGGSTAAAIDALTAKIANLTVAVTNSAVITAGSLTISDPIAGGSRVDIAPLTVSETATIMNNMKSVLQARVDALNTTLAGL
jgi:hypothetical protein